MRQGVSLHNKAGQSNPVGRQGSEKQAKAQNRHFYHPLKPDGFAIMDHEDSRGIRHTAELAKFSAARGLLCAQRLLFLHYYNYLNCAFGIFFPKIGK